MRMAYKIKYYLQYIIPFVYDVNFNLINSCTNIHRLYQGRTRDFVFGVQALTFNVGII